MKKKFIMLFLFLFANECFASDETKQIDYNWSEVELLSLEFERYRQKHDAYFLIYKDDGTTDYKSDWDFGAKLVFNVGLFDNTIHWNNNMFLTMAEQYHHVRHAGLESSFDLHLFSGVDLFAYHLSEHMLEMTRRDDLHFPTTDSIGIRFFFIDNRGRNSNAIFD